MYTNEEDTYDTARDSRAAFLRLLVANASDFSFVRSKCDAHPSEKLVVACLVAVQIMSASTKVDA